MLRVIDLSSLIRSGSSRSTWRRLAETRAGIVDREMHAHVTQQPRTLGEHEVIVDARMLGDLEHDALGGVARAQPR